MHLGTLSQTETLGTLAIVVGLVVRVLKSKRMNDWLDAAPPEWVKPIPRAWLPWIAVLLGALVTTADGWTHGSIHTWREALEVVLSGLMAGSAAVAGNETLGRALAKPAAVVPVEPPPPEPAPETPKSEEKPS